MILRNIGRDSSGKFRLRAWFIVSHRDFCESTAQPTSEVSIIHATRAKLFFPECQANDFWLRAEICKCFRPIEVFRSKCFANEMQIILSSNLRTKVPLQREMLAVRIIYRREPQMSIGQRNYCKSFFQRCFNSLNQLGEQKFDAYVTFLSRGELSPANLNLKPTSSSPASAVLKSSQPKPGSLRSPLCLKASIEFSISGWNSHSRHVL